MMSSTTSPLSLSKDSIVPCSPSAIGGDGAEQVDTLQNCYNLAMCLQAEKKTAEALNFAQRALGWAKTIRTRSKPSSW